MTYWKDGFDGQIMLGPTNEDEGQQWNSANQGPNQGNYHDNSATMNGFHDNKDRTGALNLMRNETIRTGKRHLLNFFKMAAQY